MRSADICANLRETARRVRLSGEWGEMADTLEAAADHIESLRREVRTQRLEIAGLREERRALLEADRPPGWQTDPT
jgi:hypothetical protein